MTLEPYCCDREIHPTRRRLINEMYNGQQFYDIELNCQMQYVVWFQHVNLRRWPHILDWVLWIYLFHIL